MRFLSRGPSVSGLKQGTFAIRVEYPYVTSVRLLEKSKGGLELAERFAAERETYIDRINRLAEFADHFARISVNETRPPDPFWNNGMMPSYDAAALYGFIATNKPALYLEVGSGDSTKFARRSIQDHGLDTRIVSVDPHPKSNIDSLCDQVIRQPVENIDIQSLAEMLAPGDILFVDGTHRSFQGSDVTVIFTELLPAIKPGVMIGFHDIFLPYDYPSLFKDYYYNEQYLLMLYLLGNGKDKIALPVNYCCHDQELWTLYTRCFQRPNLEQVNLGGSAFWLIKATG